MPDELTTRQQKYIALHTNGFAGPGMNFASFGPIYDWCCDDCDDSEEFGDEGHFSCLPCGICGCHLGGDRYIWHWLNDSGEMFHEDDGCTDCMIFACNGGVPADETLSWIDELDDD